MPGRKIPLITGSTYHVFNRGVAKMPTFIQDRDYERLIQDINYYRFANVPLKYSQLQVLSSLQQEQIMKSLVEKDEKLVKILSFVLMPNHFHFLLEQLTENGISKFIANVTNSYTKFFNTKKSRVGPLFQGRFKAVLIETEEQLIHVHRYHHLNPYTDGIVGSFEELLHYQYSSLPAYIGKSHLDFVDSELILSRFEDIKTYTRFLHNQTDYQRRLAKIKKLLLE